MKKCDHILETIFLGGSLDAESAAHVQECERCQREEPVTRALAQCLATDAPLDPPAGLTTRVLEATGPLLAERARLVERPPRRYLARAIIVALLPLPAILFLHAYLLQAAYAVLSSLLPAALSAYLVFNYTALIVLLITLTYGAVPLFAHRQMRLGREMKWA